jgi:hypothetical protein
MIRIPNGARLRMYRLVTLIVVVSIFVVASSFAQTAGRKYDVELAVPKDKKTVMTDATLTFDATTVMVVPEKASMQENTKQFAYTDIKQADASYSKKPMLSGGGAIATALLVGFIFALPFLFIKKKKHWMTIQNGKEFAVMQLGDNNWREIAAELQTHNVKVNDLKEVEKSQSRSWLPAFCR